MRRRLDGETVAAVIAIIITAVVVVLFVWAFITVGWSAGS